MRHVQVISKAALSWFEASPLTILTNILSFISSTVLPIITQITDAKQATEDDTTS